MHYPGYLELYETGELAKRAEAAWEVLRSCTICPQNCRCDRIAGKTGVCHSKTRSYRRILECPSPRGTTDQRDTRSWHYLFRLLPGALHLLPEFFPQPGRL